ncbi:hypothetical protein [Pseudomonas sp. PDM04]|jgi:hypothetical protein|uniref:hypothetical protein n=1 Tax=Pseudomonas sp. PDM04 TaxID=2769296 RepID=UPI00177D635A|nr:hypothetical protein [Pseudomonas sp. PDM04]MBD9440946.1 hypothetical protein [Pseudomonas sp. PDM04]
MLVSAKPNLVTPLVLKKPGEEPNAEAAAGLQGGLQAALMQNVQNNIQLQNSKEAGNVQAAVSKQSTEQVNAANKISDNIDEAFAKTRVELQTTYAPLPEGTKERIGTSGSATQDFKDWMAKSPEQRIRDAILEEMGLTQEEVDQMPPEKQQAIGEEIAKRMQDKAAIAKTEEAQQSGDPEKAAVVDKFLASL